MPRDDSREQPQWLLARHSALTARQLLRAYGLLCLFSLTIAAAFALRGIWTIPVFSFAELGLVAIALLHYLRHARDYEHIALRDGELIVEQVSAGHCRRHHYSPWRTRIAVSHGPRQWTWACTRRPSGAGRWRRNCWPCCHHPCRRQRRRERLTRPATDLPTD